MESSKEVFETFLALKQHFQKKNFDFFERQGSIGFKKSSTVHIPSPKLFRVFINTKPDDFIKKFLFVVSQEKNVDFFIKKMIDIDEESYYNFLREINSLERTFTKDIEKWSLENFSKEYLEKMNFISFLILNKICRERFSKNNILNDKFLEFFDINYDKFSTILKQYLTNR